MPEAKDDPFALFLDEKEAFRGLYLEAEADSGYLRDRNVFGEPITIEDTMALTVRYRNGILMSYCLIAYSPWEGLRVAITGKSVGPGVYDCLAILGQASCLARIDRACHK